MWSCTDLSLEGSAGVRGGDGGFCGDDFLASVLITRPGRAGDVGREDFGVINPVRSPMRLSVSEDVNFGTTDR